ncbi:hypothetical protein CPB83DRAFT_808241 [Crepidotus variabilis]|uniref:Uncharacterized protein n=1 Tax=Crepidotus variabilis TaxID=179855 RepID=A0A9P6JSJ3_9AGAR|nr:hypothetical protein CPB83DRAFT_808241 [Crepidotus variabilis]
MPKSREYCCCAIPLVNPGIYVTLIEQTVLGILIGALSVATPQIVGSATPKFASFVLAIIAFVGAGVQLLGFIGVFKEKPSTFRRYVKLHMIITTAGFAVAAAWIVWSAIGHSKAKQRCITDFFDSVPGSNQNSSDTICNIMTWVLVGIMGGIWALLAALQLYLFVVISSYSKNQREDHSNYDRVYDPSQPLKAENIPMENDPWDSRMSTDHGLSSQNHNYRHVRQESNVSASDVLSEPAQQHHKDSLSSSRYHDNEYDPYDPEESQQPTYPSYAYTQQAQPTPAAQNQYYRDDVQGYSQVERPSQAQPHPGI